MKFHPLSNDIGLVPSPYWNNPAKDKKIGKFEKRCMDHENMRIFFRNFFSKNLVNLYLTRCQRCLEYGKLLKTAFELKNRSYKKPTKNKKRVSTMKESNHRVPFPHPAALPLNHPTAVVNGSSKRIKEMRTWKRSRMHFSAKSTENF